MQLFTLPKDDPDAEAILLASEEELRRNEEAGRRLLEQRERERRPVLVSYEI